MAHAAAVSTPEHPATGSPLQQAFHSAMAEHSAPAEPAAVTEEAPVDEPVVPSDPSPAPTPDATADADPDVTASDLFSDADIAAIQAKYPDPIKQAKAFQAAWTKKTQAHAEVVKADKAKIELADALMADPLGTLEALGLPVPQTADERRTEHTQQTAQQIAEAMTARVKAALGPDYEFMAGPLATAMRLVAEETAKAVVEQTVQPLQKAQQDMFERTAAEQTSTAMQTFATKHPDWQTHEAKMVELGQKLQPNGMSEVEYLDHLYTLATIDQQVAARTKAAIEKMTKGAKTADRSARTVPETQVQATTANRKPTIREAFLEAKAEAEARGGAR